MRLHDTRTLLSATPSPADSLVAHGRLAHPSHALAGTPPATREARATAEAQVIECTQERVDGVV
jgi:hypothetical protein